LARSGWPRNPYDRATGGLVQAREQRFASYRGPDRWPCRLRECGARVGRADHANSSPWHLLTSPLRSQGSGGVCRSSVSHPQCAVSQDVVAYRPACAGNSGADAMLSMSRRLMLLGSLATASLGGCVMVPVASDGTPIYPLATPAYPAAVAVPVPTV